VLRLSTLQTLPDYFCSLLSLPAQCSSGKLSGSLPWALFFIALALHSADVGIHLEIGSP